VERRAGGGSRPGDIEFHGRRTVAVQGRTQIDWLWFTYVRVAVLRELEAEHTEREAAANIGVEYSTVRGHVEDLKSKLGVSAVKDLRWWWRGHREAWLAWCAKQGGIDWRDAG